MGIFDGCLLAADIDGTLISGESLPERNIERIKYFVSEGGAFSLSTGRAAGGVSAVTKKIDCISPSVLLNGCVIYDFCKKKPVYEEVLPEKSLEMAKKAKEYGIGFELHSADRVFVPSRCAASDLHESYENMPVEFTGFNEAKNQRINKIIYFIEQEKQKELLCDLSKEYTDSCVFYDTCTFIGGQRQNYFEQLPKGVSKATALNNLCKILKIKKGGCFAIGDYYNDLEMIKAADVGAVPSGSPADLKSAADVTVGPAESGAVADFINYLEAFLKNGK